MVGISADSAAGNKDRPCSGLRLLGLFLTMHHPGELVGKDLLGLVELTAFPGSSISSTCSSGRKVSMRMHFITSASPTFRQYW